MVIKLYLSEISASKEIKKRQQRAKFILDSLKIEYENIDITEPQHENEKLRMKEVCKKRDNKPALPPQFFNDDEYCGDWIDFENAGEVDEIPVFLKLEQPKSETEAMQAVKDGKETHEDKGGDETQVESTSTDASQDFVPESGSGDAVTVSN